MEIWKRENLRAAHPWKMQTLDAKFMQIAFRKENIRVTFNQLTLVTMLKILQLTTIYIPGSTGLQFYILHIFVNSENDGVNDFVV